MSTVNTVFFGSTSDSLLVLQQLYTVVAVVTQIPKPIGREHIIHPTPVEVWAKEHGTACLAFPTKKDRPWEYENEQTVIDTLQPLKAELLISASYGQKIPAPAVSAATCGGLNVHPSLLPRWRGTDPVPWTILSGDRQTGVTIVTLSSRFDTGKIIAQTKVPVTDKDTTIPLRKKLFTLGAELLTASLPDYLSGKNKGYAQKAREEPYAMRLTRADGYEPWEHITDSSQAERINRKFRAYHPWPGLWTTFNKKRLKILSFDETPLLVQLEGKTPVSWKQFTAAYFSP